MTDKHLTKVALLYLKKLQELHVKPQRHDGIKPTDEATVRLEHAGWMCQKIIGYVESDFREKASRWLGFVQGMLWYEQIYSVDEMREHNKADL
jgi:hypothetical protein